MSRPILCNPSIHLITIIKFNMVSMNNTLFVGVPVLRAMYGVEGENLVVQASVIQSLLFFPILLFLFEFRRTFWINRNSTTSVDDIESHQGKNDMEIENIDEVATTNSTTMPVSSTRSSDFWSTMYKVWVKLAKNPNCYASALGLIWALLAKRWNFEMPSIFEGSILIMAKAGTGVAMFSMGLFMALQEKMIACGLRLMLYEMFMRFVGAPVITTVGCAALGLRSDILRIAIIQAALPQAVGSFVFAQEYGLHADALNTAVIFGTIVSLPLLIGYYAVLDVIH